MSWASNERMTQDQGDGLTDIRELMTICDIRSRTTTSLQEGGSWTPNQRASALGARLPNPSVDQADQGEIGRAYRIPSEPSHASQPGLPSTSKRRVRRMGRRT
jgi:hypothetical protein